MFLGIGWLGLLMLSACGGATGGTETGNATPGSVGYAVGDSIDTVGGLVSDPNQAPVAFRKAPITLLRVAEELILGSPAYAAICSLTATCDDLNHIASIVVDFDGGCEVDPGVVATGKRYFSWFKMGANACPYPNLPPRIFNAIQGQGATLVRATDTIDPNNLCSGITQSVVLNFPDGRQLNITECGVLTYTDFQQGINSAGVTETLTLPASHRVLLDPQGRKIFDHILSTGVPIQVTDQRATSTGFPQNKLINGSLTVSHQLAGFSVTTTYQDVFFDFTQCPCYPISGSIAITATDNQTGAVLGTGSASFQGSQTGICNDVQATYQGKAVTIPLNSCRGT